MLGQEFKADEALGILAPALEQYSGADEELVAEARLNLGRAHYLRGQYHESLAALEPGLEISERRGLTRLLILGLISRGNALWSSFRRREGLGVAEMALKLALEAGMVDLELRIRGNLANFLTESDARASVESWLELTARTRKLGQRALWLNGMGNYGFAAFLAGDWDGPLAEVESVLAEDLSSRDRLIILSNALLFRASRGEDVSQALADMTRLGDDMSARWELFAADPIAAAALAAGDLKKARDQFMVIVDADPGAGGDYLYRATRASTWARDLADAKVLADRYRDMGEFGPVAGARQATISAGIAALEGRPKEALALYRDALRGWRAANLVWDEALTGIDMAELLDPAEPEVAAAIISTRAILERLRAAPFIERLDAALAAGSGTLPARTARPAPAAELALSD